MASIRRPAALLGAIGVLTLVATGCGGGAGGTTAVAQPISLQKLSESAERSADATSGRFAFAMEMAMPGFSEQLAFTGEGAFDTKVGKTAMSLDMSAFATLMKEMAGAFGGDAGDLDLDAEAWKIEAVLDGLVMYMRFPFLSSDLSSELPDGKEWVKIDLREAAQQIPGLDLDQLMQFANNGPQSSLEYLKAVAGEIKPVGVEEVRGEQAAHYVTTIDLLKYKNLVPEGTTREALGSMFEELVKQTGLREIPVDVWVGQDNLVRRMEMTFSITQPGSPDRLDASMTFEMFDYGKPVEIILPLEAETASVADLRRLGS